MLLSHLFEPLQLFMPQKKTHSHIAGLFNMQQQVLRIEAKKKGFVNPQH